MRNGRAKQFQHHVSNFAVKLFSKLNCQLQDWRLTVRTASHHVSGIPAMPPSNPAFLGHRYTKSTAIQALQTDSDPLDRAWRQKLLPLGVPAAEILTDPSTLCLMLFDTRDQLLASLTTQETQQPPSHCGRSYASRRLHTRSTQNTNTNSQSQETQIWHWLVAAVRTAGQPALAGKRGSANAPVGSSLVSQAV